MMTNRTFDHCPICGQIITLTDQQTTDGRLIGTCGDAFTAKQWGIQRPAGSLPTVWSLRTYDVWGNARDGYEVNDNYDAGEVELRIPQTRYNVGRASEFIGAFPSDRQIKRAFGVNCRISIDGDDLTVYVEREKDGYPIGEMHCESHASLSPVRKA